MPTFAFETITSAEALALGPDDRITVAAGSGMTSTVLFQADGTLSVTIGTRTVEFGARFADLARAGQIAFPDGSQLYVGTAGSDTRDFGLFTPGKGAIYGGEGNDQFAGGAGAWLMQGNQGDDVLQPVSTFANTIYGGQGNDSVAMSVGPPPVGQFVQGNKGDDQITAAGGADTLLGGQGNDIIRGNGGQDFINGNLGNDSLSGTGQLFGEDGADTVQGAADGTSMISGGGGNDSLTSIGALHDELFGGDGDDKVSSALTSVVAGDLLDGGEGNDTLTALAGDDRLVGGGGNDSLSAGSGANTLEGGAGNDILDQRQNAGGNLKLGGADLLDGGDGADTLLSGNGASTLLGGEGNDSLTGGGTGILVDGGAGDDRLTLIGSGRAFGGDGADIIDVTGGALSIDGGAGNDFIRAWRGADTIEGGAGADTIDGGGGVDLLFGGAGGDRFLFLNNDGPPTPGSASRILDWSSEDRIQFRNDSGAPAGLLTIDAVDFANATTKAVAMLGNSDNLVVAVQVGSDLVLYSGGFVGQGINASVVLIGRTLADIASDNFV